MKTFARTRVVLLAAAIVIVTAASTRLNADTGTCGGASISLPFTDVASTNIFFCSIAEAFFSGLANGTTATTYNPGDPVPREQMAAFVSRAMDQSVKRAGKRAALDQFWTTGPGLTAVGNSPRLVKSDGADLWVANLLDSTVSRVRGSDGRVLQTWTGATGAAGVLVAMGKVFVSGFTDPGSLYKIDPTQPAGGAVTTLSTGLGSDPYGIAYDGQRIWTANTGSSVSIISLNPTTVNNITGFGNPRGILYDGSNIWITDFGDGTLKKLDSSGTVVQSITVGLTPQFPCFDGTNIWVPNTNSHTVSVIRASTGVVLATLSGNGLNEPRAAAFDGERIMVTNGMGNSVSLWRASDLTAIGTFSTGAATFPLGVCSDGLSFWVTLNTGNLARF